LARDLTPEGAEAVTKNAEELANSIKPNEEIAIWSSPFGRNLAAAKIIVEVLQTKGIQWRKKAWASRDGIKTFCHLSEVRNFSWKLFEPLVSGGNVVFGERKIFVDKKASNPRDLNPQEYFAEDGIDGLNQELRNSLPDCYLEAIDAFEKFADVTDRMIRVLSRLKKIEDKSYRVIIVTHDALSGFICRVSSAGKKTGLDPGEFISLERRDGKLVAIKVGGTEKSESSPDVIEEFSKLNSS